MPDSLGRAQFYTTLMNCANLKPLLCVCTLQMAGCERSQPDVHQVLGGVPAGHPGGCVARRKSAYGLSTSAQPAAEGQHQATSLTLSDESPTGYIYTQRQTMLST